VVRPGNAAVLELGGMSRIVLPGVTVTRHLEQVKAVVDLRPQSRTGTVEDVLTRDMIPLDITYEVNFQIRVGSDTSHIVEGKISQEKELTGVVSVDKADIFKAVYRVPRPGWQDAVASTTGQMLRNSVARFSFDEIFGLLQSDTDTSGLQVQHPTTISIAEQVRESLMETTSVWGVQINSVTLTGIHIQQELQRMIVDRVGTEFAHTKTMTEVRQALMEETARYSCFISYSSKDYEFTYKLHADLQGEGVRCWFAPEDMKIGDKIRPTLDRSVRQHDKLLIILSENSITSDWVEQEVETALDRERQEKRTVLFPIRLDDAVMEIDVGWPALIRNTRHIGDFGHWKDHDEYQQAFGRLLRDLKAED